MALLLTIVEGRGRGQRYRFDGERVAIGRGAENEVVLDDPAVSRAHARIERQGAGWTLIDGGSANGTALNGAALAKPGRLREGDQVRVGSVTFEICTAGEPGEEEVQGTRISAGPAAKARAVDPRAGRSPRGSKLLRHAKLAACAVGALLLALAARFALPDRKAQRVLARGAEEGPLALAREEAVAMPTNGDLAAARQAYERGRRKLDERRIAPRNLYDAWKAFNEARRQLEGLAQKPALYGEAAQLAGEARRDLEKECSRLLFSAARFERYGQADRAQQAYREVLLHFPGEDPAGCRKKAQDNIVPAQAAEGAE